MLKTPSIKQIIISLSIIIPTVTISVLLFLAPPEVYILRQFYELDIKGILLLSAFFILLFRIKASWKNTISLPFTMALFFLSLIYKWKTSDSYFLFGGLLPLSDANGYYADAQNLIFGLPISSIGIYRPVYTSFLSVLFKLAEGNLCVVLIILVAINALAIHSTAREIQKSLRSSIAPAIFLILGYLFYRRFSGTLMTENLGFCLGNLALLFLLRGARQKSLPAVLYGIFLLTIGLNARAGAFLVLPVMAIWAGLTFTNTKWSWHSFSYALMTIATGMIASMMLAYFLTISGSFAQSNYADNLYGLASGNTGYEQAAIDHPMASKKEVLQVTLDKIQANPFIFIKSIATAYTDYFETSNGAFSFLLLKHDRDQIANLILWVLTFAGLTLMFLDRKKQGMGLGLALFGGIVLSIGLVPPIDAVKMRVYAATIPITCFIIANGFLLPRAFMSSNNLEQVEETDTVQWDFVFSLGLVAATLVFPFLIKSIGSIPETKNTALSCLPGEQAMNLVISPGSSIFILPHPSETYVPAVNVFQFITQISLPEEAFTEKEKAFLSKTAATEQPLAITIIRASWLEEQKHINSGSFLMTENLPRSGTYAVCAKPAEEKRFFSARLPAETATPETSTPLNLNKTAQGPIRITYTIGLWLIIGFLFLHLFKVEHLPKKLQLIGALNTLVIVLGIMIFLHYMGIIPLMWQTINIPSRAIRHRDGFLYTFNLNTTAYSDSLFLDYPAHLYENKMPLGPAHESQSLTTQYGGGRYIIKGEILFFSNIDNSNPRESGRQYTLQVPVRLRTRHLIFTGILFMAGLLAEVLFFKRYKQSATFGANSNNSKVTG